MSESPSPELPERVARLPELARDLWWSWNPPREVFRRLDYPLWRRTSHNPVRMLQEIDADTLARAAADPDFVAKYDEALRELDSARSAGGAWWERQLGPDRDRVVAYFCAEFALHQSLPIYAGGLGVLAGDHCKEASDLGVPFVGVGFMYPQGYFRQRVSGEGWQQEVYERLDWDSAPIGPARTASGAACVVQVPLAARTVSVRVWEVRLGGVRILLLDTDTNENAPWDRELTARLYGGGQDTRLQQEIVLGLGGVLALRALGITPFAWHLNEGHAAFVVLQRLRDYLAQRVAWDAALGEVRRTTIFTTHTPVPAGHDAFPFQLVEQHLAGCWGSLDGSRNQFLNLGSYDSGHGAQFNMTALAMRSARAINAVSHLHRQVTRQMFAPLWPDAAEHERPVSAVANGVHVPTWVSGTFSDMFDRHIGPNWRDEYDDPSIWQRILTVPDEDLWQARCRLRSYLVHFVRDRARQRWTAEGAGASRVLAGGVMLDPDVLTIGFARRFTAYKRPDLVFHDLDRLERLVKAVGRPVQFVFAGKAHPADDAGKHHLQTVFRRAVDPRLGGRVAFVDDYDMHVAKYLVQGCDVWLNTPRKPLEASGTSGMKASMNGALHLSIGDGWWAEGYNGWNGWQIVGSPASTDVAAVDAADAQALYDLLERDVVPSFYERDGDGLPRRWLAMVKHAVLTVTPQFSTRRMLKEYVARAYAPAMDVTSSI